MGTDFPVDIPASDDPFAPGRSVSTSQVTPSFGMLNPNNGGSSEQPGNDGARYYTIQRVNGNGANGKGDGTAGAHKHSIEDSDRVKKSSIYRHFLKEEKEKRKSMVSDRVFCSVIAIKNRVICFPRVATFKQQGTTPTSSAHIPEAGHLRHCTFHSVYYAVMIPRHHLLFKPSNLKTLTIYTSRSLSILPSMSENADSNPQKTYHKKATGAALNTVKKHSKDHDLKLYGSCFW